MIRSLLFLMLILFIPGITKGLEPEDSYPTLQAKGVVYTNVTVTSRTAARLMISHSKGINTVLIEELEPELRQKYLPSTNTAALNSSVSAQSRAVVSLDEELSHEDYVEHHLITNSELRYSIQISNAYILSAEDRKLLQMEIEQIARENKLSIDRPLKISDSWSIESDRGYDPIIFVIIPLGPYGKLEISRMSLRRARDLPMIKAVSTFESPFRSTTVATYRLVLTEDSEEHLGFVVFLPLKPQVLFIQIYGSLEDEPQLRAELANLLNNLEATVDHQRIVLRDDNSISPTGWKMIAWWASVTVGLILVFVFLYKWLIGSNQF